MLIWISVPFWGALRMAQACFWQDLKSFYFHLSLSTENVRFCLLNGTQWSRSLFPLHPLWTSCQGVTSANPFQTHLFTSTLLHPHPPSPVPNDSPVCIQGVLRWTLLLVCQNPAKGCPWHLGQISLGWSLEPHVITASLSPASSPIILSPLSPQLSIPWPAGILYFPEKPDFSLSLSYMLVPRPDLCLRVFPDKLLMFIPWIWA